MKFLLYVAGLAGLVPLVGSVCDDVVVPLNDPSPTLQQAASFPVGFAISQNPIQTAPLYRQTVIQEGSSITADVAMKPGRISPQKGVYNFEAADQLIDFSKAQKKPNRTGGPAARRVHGHTLVWYIDTSPNWLKQIRDSTELETTLQDYIQTVGTHFKGNVASWDVVNEAFDNNQGRIRTN